MRPRLLKKTASASWKNASRNYIAPRFSFIQKAPSSLPDRRNTQSSLFRWSRRGPLGSGTRIQDILNKGLESPEGVARNLTGCLPLMKFSMLPRLVQTSFVPTAANGGSTKHSLHPPAETSATEDDLFIIAVDDSSVCYSEVRSHGTGWSLRVRIKR